MSRKNLIERRLEQGRTTFEIADEVRRRLDSLPEVCEGLAYSSKRVKNAAAKILSRVSETHPERLYDKAGVFIAYLDGEETILKWNAADIVSNLARVDKRGKINRKVLEKFFVFLDDESMVTAGHAIDNLWKIARAKPRFRKDITRQLLRVKSVRRERACQEILAGKVIVSLDRFFEHVTEADQKAVINFVKKQLTSEHAATKKKAEAFLRRVGCAQ